MNIRVAGILAGTMLVTASAAFGSVKEGSFTATPLVGAYMYDSRQHAGAAFLMGARAGYNITNAFGVEALYNFTQRSPASAGPFSRVATQRFGAQALYHFFPESVLVPYVAAGLSGTTFNSPRNDNIFGTFDYGAGVKYFVTDDIALRGDVRHLIYRFDSATNHNAEVTMGAYFQFGGTAAAMTPVKTTPLPEPPKITEAPKTEPAKVVADPVQPKTVIPPPVDTDGDGVPDMYDRCPGTPKGVKVDSIGCPIDSDRDGVPDYRDKCPGTAYGAMVDYDGCTAAPAPPAITKPACGKPSPVAIVFDNRKAVIKPEFHPELDKFGRLLKEFETAKVSINGHTDSAGGKKANLKLSKARAESVKSYLVKKFNISSDRITARGYGEERPVASNKTAAGKAKNRRIEAVFSCD